jgi:hypothetical protein
VAQLKISLFDSKDEDMNNYTIVRQEHLNHYGFLFGGALLQWVDEYAWLVASLDYPNCPLVRTRSASAGQLTTAPSCVFRSSVERHLSNIPFFVFADPPGSTEKRIFFRRPLPLLTSTLTVTRSHYRAKTGCVRNKLIPLESKREVSQTQ